MAHDVLCLRPRADFERVTVLPPARLEVEYRSPEDSEIQRLLKEAKALVIPAVGPKLPGVLFEKTRLRLVQVTGAGVDRLDEAALKKAGIPVANVPGGSNSAVAEYVITAASTLLRRFAWADSEIRKGNYADFRKRMVADNLPGLGGLTLGLVGLGTIGMAVAGLAAKIGMGVRYFDPQTGHAPAAARLGAKPATLEELLRTADVVSVHVPLVPATVGLIAKEQLELMKAGAVLVQGSRGSIVDESALAARLESGQLGGAAVDVYSTEPPAVDNPLLRLRGEAASRLLLTPHIAGVTRQASAFLFRSAWDNVARVLLEKAAPHNRVY
jgi:phosphoglycerate dehydrogenase-like enzyme